MTAQLFSDLLTPARSVQKRAGTARTFGEILGRAGAAPSRGPAAARVPAAGASPGRILAVAKRGDRMLAWAIASTAGGPPDTQGDVILEEDLVAAAHSFMQAGGEVRAMHRGRAVGRVVESLVLTSEVQEALGISLPYQPWVVCLKVEDAAIWRLVKSGELGALSIGGRAVREPIGDG